MASEDEDSSVGLCNGSLGREIMQVVQKNEKQVHKVKVSFASVSFLRFLNKHFTLFAVSGGALCGKRPLL